MIDNNNFFFTASPAIKESLITINKGIYGIIINYLTKVKPVRLKLNLELNQTIKKENSVYIYLTSIEGKEFFQRLSQNQVLNFITGIFRNKNLFEFEELVSLISNGSTIDATKEEIISYIDKLLEIGFLRFKIGIPEQQIEWIYELCNILKDIENEDIQLLVKSLKNIEAKAKIYSRQPITKRFNEINELQIVLEEFYKKIDANVQIGANLPFYEDSSSNSTLG